MLSAVSAVSAVEYHHGGHGEHGVFIFLCALCVLGGWIYWFYFRRSKRGVSFWLFGMVLLILWVMRHKSLIIDFSYLSWKGKTISTIPIARRWTPTAAWRSGKGRNCDIDLSWKICSEKGTHFMNFQSVWRGRLWIMTSWRIRFVIMSPTESTGSRC